MRLKLTLLSIFICIVLLISTVTAVQFPIEKPSVVSGKKIYNLNCIGCHGVKGDGSVFKGAPDFTDHEIMKDKTSSVFFDAVSEGLRGTSMPGFTNLPISQRWDVLAYIWTFWADKDSAERGKKIFESKCVSCHGIKGDGTKRPDAFVFTKPANMDRTPSAYFNSLSEGVPDSSMRLWKNALSENERWDAVKYVWTFQFKDYTDATEPMKLPIGNGIILISFAMASGMVYLSGKRMRER